MESLEKGSVLLAEGREKSKGVKKALESREEERKVVRNPRGEEVFRRLRIKSDGNVLGIRNGMERRSVAAGKKIFSRDVCV